MDPTFFGVFVCGPVQSLYRKCILSEFFSLSSQFELNIRCSKDRKRKLTTV